MATTAATVSTATTAQAKAPDADAACTAACEHTERKRRPIGDADKPPAGKRQGGVGPAVDPALDLAAASVGSAATSEDYGPASAVGLLLLENLCPETRSAHPKVSVLDVRGPARSVKTIRVDTEKEGVEQSANGKTPESQTVTRTVVVLVCPCADLNGIGYEAWLALPPADELDLSGVLGGGRGPAELCTKFTATASSVVSGFVVAAAAKCGEPVRHFLRRLSGVLVEDFLHRLRNLPVLRAGLMHRDGYEFAAVVLMLLPLYDHLSFQTVLAIVPHVVTSAEEEPVDGTDHDFMYAFAVVTSLEVMMKDGARLQAAAMALRTTAAVVPCPTACPSGSS